MTNDQSGSSTSKFYELDGKVKCKGFPKLTAADLAVLVDGGQCKIPPKEKS